MPCVHRAHYLSLQELGVEEASTAAPRKQVCALPSLKRKPCPAPEVHICQALCLCMLLSAACGKHGRLHPAPAVEGPQVSCTAPRKACDLTGMPGVHQRRPQGGGCSGGPAALRLGCRAGPQAAGRAQHLQVSPSCVPASAAVEVLWGSSWAAQRLFAPGCPAARPSCAQP